MRKSILMGTREDVIKRRAKQANNAPVHNNNSNRTSGAVMDALKVLGTSVNKSTHPSQGRIVTFNHPCINN